MWLGEVYRTAIAPTVDTLAFACPPGPPVLPLRYIINVFKAGTLPACLALMAWTGNSGLEANVITGIHGGYGICWLLKDMVMPDASWRRPATVVSCLIAVLTLCLYWSAAYIIIVHRVTAEPSLVMLSILLAMVGTCVMMAADAQKFFVLQLRAQLKPSSGHAPFLISDGWFSHVRNTNYFGEILVYSSFCLLAQHPFPWAVVVTMWTVMFASRWAQKDASIRRKPGGEEYLRRTWLVWPGVL
jgi:protein-S-isoprenylcysteine O-methyltransferase Ste14